VCVCVCVCVCVKMSFFIYKKKVEQNYYYFESFNQLERCDPSVMLLFYIEINIYLFLKCYFKINKYDLYYNCENGSIY